MKSPLLTLLDNDMEPVEVRQLIDDGTLSRLIDDAPTGDLISVLAEARAVAVFLEVSLAQGGSDVVAGAVSAWTSIVVDMSDRLRAEISRRIDG